MAVKLNQLSSIRHTEFLDCHEVHFMFLVHFFGFINLNLTYVK